MTTSKSFHDMNLIDPILKGIDALGFETPTPVQAKVIPWILNNDRDLVALAQTGTGKTAAFGLPLLQQINLKDTQTQCLILCPTRELCLQIARDLGSYSKYMASLKVLAVYGGSPIEQQIRALKRGVQVIVATPGRLIDLLERKVAKIGGVTRIILDEADEMLNMGFQEDLEKILTHVPDGSQTLLFSATMPKGVARISKRFMSNAEEITLGKRGEGAENVRHEVVTVHAKDRYNALKRLVDVSPDMYGIIFCRTRVETKDVAAKLIQDGYNADALHGDLSQGQRDHVMGLFRKRALTILVATDVAARGLDVNDLTHVINFNLPDDAELYTHRSGRTGRAGRSGLSIVIVHMREKGRIRQIERILGKRFESRAVPGGQEVCEAQLLSLIERVKGVKVDHKQIDLFMPAIHDTLEGMDREELIKHFVSLEFNRFLSYYKNARDLNVESDGRSERPMRSDRPTRSDRSSRSERSERSERPDRSGNQDRSESPRERRHREFDESNTLGADVTRIFVNLGRLDKVTPKTMIGLINSSMDSSISIGRIDILKSYSFVDVNSDDAPTILSALNNALYHDRPVKADPVENDDGRRPDRPEVSSRSSAHPRTAYKGKKSGPGKRPGKPFKKVRHRKVGE